MSISPQELFKQKKYPKWIANHPIFKKIEKIDKVFPGIGLKNSIDEQIVSSTKAATKSAKILLSSIEEKLSKRAEKLQEFGQAHPKMGKERKDELNNILALLNEIRSLLKGKELDKCIVINNDKITLKLSRDISIPGAKRPTFRQSESIFRVYNKLNDLLKKPKFAALKNLEETADFKNFSSTNVPSTKYKIVFSSDNADGIWDISTMSQRGIRSCQSWEDGEYKHGVIGSMIDPFVGIIYLTTGNNYNEYGSKMIRRCIVRFVVDGEKRKPYLVIDHMYPSHDQNVVEQFKEFLITKTNGKFPVYYGPDLTSTNYKLHSQSYIPLTKVRQELESFGRADLNWGRARQSIIAYQDIHFPSKKSSKDPKEELFEKNSSKKSDKFVTKFVDAASEALREINTNLFPDAIKPAIKMLKGEDAGKLMNHSDVVPGLMTSLAKEFVSSVDKSNFTNSDTYVRRIYYNYFNQKEKTFDLVKNKFVQELNGKLKLRAKRNKLKSEHIIVMMQIILGKTDAIMKENLMKLVSKRKFSGAAPIP